METPNNEVYWRKRAGAVARKVNAAWWWQSFAPIIVGASLLAACAILVSRSYGVEPTAIGQAATVIGIVAGSAIAAFVLAKRRFIGEPGALVRIEEHRGLHNALTAASRGIAPWPPPRDGMRTLDGTAWSARWVWLPPVAATALVVAALLLPVSGMANKDAAPVSPPLAWAQVEDMLAKLEEESLVEPDALKKLQENIEELRAQPTEEWYSHSSLEASDHQRTKLENAISAMANELDTAEKALTMLEHFDAQLSAAAKEKLLADFGEAVEGLKLGDLPLDQNLMDALEGLDPSKLKSLTPEQLAKLKEQLKSGTTACKSCLGEGSGVGEGLAWGDLEEAELLALINGGTAPGGTLPGRGGVNRGPGTAPITLSPNEADLGTNNLEAVSNDDLSRALPADLIGTSVGEHDLDKSATAPTSAGVIQSEGEGGQKVWRDTLLPAEKAVLKRYFK